MADTGETIREELEKQIADMKKEMTKMSKAIATRASDALDDAGDAYEEGKGRARHLATNVRDQANVAVGAMRDNPGTTATVLTSVGLLGFAAGLVLSGVLSGDRRR